MKQTLLVWLLGLALLLLAAGIGSSIAGAGPAAPVTEASVAQGSAALGWVRKPMSPLVKQTSWRCRRDCDWCRRDCYGRFRIRCWGPYCREQFTLCMRECWYAVCRWC